MQATTQSTAPEQHFIINAHKGWISYTVASHGKAAHSSMPKLGINAIDNLVQYYNAEKAFYHSLTERHPGLGKTVYAPDVFVGGKQVNSIPDLAVEKVKVRTIPELSNENLVRKLRELIQKLNEIPTMNLELTVEQSEDRWQITSTTASLNSFNITRLPFWTNHWHCRQLALQWGPTPRNFGAIIQMANF